MDKKRPQILITNDDGYAAKGLRKLVALMRTLGDVVLISTDEVMSAKSHSCSIHNRIYVRLVQEEEGFKEYRCNGTPVDCVKLGYQKLMAQPPDLVVSGINHGMNAATTVVYSGTIGAVIEACMNGLNAIGYSLNENTRMGAYQTELSYTIANLTTASENTQASESVIRDTDMAKAMMEHAKYNILSQSAQSMLAQANQNSSSVLSLLQ